MTNLNKVEIIADSLSPESHRLTTIKVTFPRFLLAEVNTHRMFSRSSASSRAIRFSKMVESVENYPFVPFKWQKDHAGMQGTEYFDDAHRFRFFSTHKDGFEMLVKPEDAWLEARDHAVQVATEMNKNGGITKQVCNRLLEPFMYHTALITATEWENFFALRAEGAAEIHFQDLAEKALIALNSSEPKRLKHGEWHLPFGDNIEEDELIRYHSLKFNENPTEEELYKLRRKISTVRCARISYSEIGKEQKMDIEADLKLHDRLSASGHWSAFEHCAIVMTEEEYYSYVISTPIKTIDGEVIGTDEYLGWCGNFRGFIQYRKMFPMENRADSRLKKWVY